MNQMPFEAEILRDEAAPSYAKQPRPPLRRLDTKAIRDCAERQSGSSSASRLICGRRSHRNPSLVLAINTCLRLKLRRHRSSR